MAPIPQESIPGRLRSFLERETGSEVAVDGLRPLAGGASRAAYALDIRVRSGAHSGVYPAVLRLDLGGKIYESSLERGEEFEVIARARAGGVPVPRPLWRSQDPAVLERSFLVLERIEGETIGRRVTALPELAGARRALPRQMGEALARIHALDPAALPFLRAPGAGSSPALRALEDARSEIERVGGAHPGLEAGLRWLLDHAPRCPQPVLVHGDFRLGNMVVGPEGLRAVLDWEFAAVGDPHEDLAWPFVRDWRFGNDGLRFGGISDGRDFIAAYEGASGRRVDRGALDYWEAMGNLRWAVGCLTQAHRHLAGAERSVELLSLGRRSAEMELEMLDRIQSMATGGSDAGPARPR